jgi:SRSO17 transposase
MDIKHKDVSNEFNRLIYGMKDVMSNELGFKNMQNYLHGLLGNAKRKNGWQMSEYMGASTPYALQQFLYRGRFSADELRDKQREYVIENIGEADGVLVVDETGFLKQGKHSVIAQHKHFLI